MNPVAQPPDLAALSDVRNYDIDSLESEISADQYAKLLLKQFHHWLLEKEQKEPLLAGQLAAGADYFLREFLIGARRQNIFTAGPEQLRQFGGNWYIISNLEPNMGELQPMLDGAALFYTYCCSLDCVTHKVAAQLMTVAAESSYFESRINSFHQLEDNGYQAWDQACPLK